MKLIIRFVGLRLRPLEAVGQTANGNRLPATKKILAKKLHKYGNKTLLSGVS